MKEFKTTAHIHSLNGKKEEITVLEKVGDNDYIVDYNGVKCHAIFNWYVCEYYADDIYGIVKWNLKNYLKSFHLKTNYK